MSLLEITGKDIADLNDNDLRDLIGLLCEADFRIARLTTSGIRYGGHQDAKDGGIDVIVDNNFPPPITSFIPKSITAFQVKKSKMPRKVIGGEMKPSGILRPSIISLAQKKGAYIIVSSGDSVSRTAYLDRISAMKEAASSREDSEGLYVDFLDSKSIATWVRSHPSLIVWVRNKIGRPYQGWQSYG